MELFLHICDQAQDLIPAPGVQTRCRLIQDQDLRPHGQDAGNGRPSFLSAGQVERRLFKIPFFHAHVAQGFRRSFAAFLFGQSQIPGAEHDIRKDRLLEQLVLRILEDQAYFGPELLLVKAFSVNVFPIVINVTGRRLQQAVEHLHQGRLAGTGMADQADEAVIGNLRADPLQGRYLHGRPGFICICNVV